MTPNFVPYFFHTKMYVFLLPELFRSKMYVFLLPELFRSKMYVFLKPKLFVLKCMVFFYQIFRIKIPHRTVKSHCFNQIVPLEFRQNFVPPPNNLLWTLQVIINKLTITTVKE